MPKRPDAFLTRHHARLGLVPLSPLPAEPLPLHRQPLRRQLRLHPQTVPLQPFERARTRCSSRGTSCERLRAGPRSRGGTASSTLLLDRCGALRTGRPCRCGAFSRGHALVDCSLASLPLAAFCAVALSHLLLRLPCLLSQALAAIFGEDHPAAESEEAAQSIAPVQGSLAASLAQVRACVRQGVPAFLVRQWYATLSACPLAPLSQGLLSDHNEKSAVPLRGTRLRVEDIPGDVGAGQLNDTPVFTLTTAAGRIHRCGRVWPHAQVRAGMGASTGAGRVWAHPQVRGGPWARPSSRSTLALTVAARAGLSSRRATRRTRTGSRTSRQPSSLRQGEATERPRPRPPPW